MAKQPKKNIRVQVDKRNRKKENPIRRKSTNAEFDKRVNIVLEMILSGLSRWQIQENIRTNEYLKEWNISRSQIDVYIKEANILMKEYAVTTKDEHLKKALNRLNFLYQKLVKVKDYKGAKDIIKTESEILGLNAPKKIETEIRDLRPLFPDDDELLKDEKE